MPKIRSNTHKPHLSHVAQLAIAARHKLTGNYSETASKCGVAVNTVKSIVQRESVLNDSKAMDVIKSRMAGKFLIAADSGADRVAELLPECDNVQQVAVVTGIMFEKYRLATDQSTENVSEHVFLELVNSVPVDADFDQTTPKQGKSSAGKGSDADTPDQSTPDHTI